MNRSGPILLGLILMPLTAIANPTPSEPRTRDWKEKGASNGLSISNSDRYVDYIRDGKVVFRTIERTVSVTTIPEKRIAKHTQRLIEFVANGNVFASVSLDGASASNWTVVSELAVYFTSGFAGGGDRRFFHVCVPGYDYYEYLEIAGTDVTLIPETAASYAASKRGFMEMTSRGFMHRLGREALLEREESRP